MTSMLEITCRDPIVCRDGRPFGARQGNRMRSLEWLLPSVLAGSLRTTLGKAARRDFSVETQQALLQVEVAGPLPQANGQLYLPAPEDCMVHRERGPIRAVPRPNDTGGCNWPVPGLQPVEVAIRDEFKPEPAPAWWPASRYASWLAGGSVGFDAEFLDAPAVEERTHVSIDPRAGAAEESQLFTTVALALAHLPRYRGAKDGKHATVAAAAARHRHGVPVSRGHPSGFIRIALSARVRATDWCSAAVAELDTLHPIGGERRLAHWRRCADTNAWNCPQQVRDALAQKRHVRMALASPAIFAGGWKPAWLDDALVGSPPGANVTLRLVGLSIQRWKPVSGWSLAGRGPKPVKRMVPAGGVYFFELVDGKAGDLADRWLEPVSDDEQDRRDGFGLAAWGVW